MAGLALLPPPAIIPLGCNPCRGVGVRVYLDDNPVLDK